eukprot:6124997-Prymnesium_polylepis.1
MTTDVIGTLELASGQDCSGCCALPPPLLPPPVLPPPSIPAEGLATVFTGDDLELMTALVTDSILMLACIA